MGLGTGIPRLVGAGRRRECGVGPEFCRSRPGEGGAPRRGPAGRRARATERLGPPRRRGGPSRRARAARAGDSRPRACPQLPSPHGLLRAARLPAPSPEPLPLPRPSPLISGRSLSGFFHPGVGGAAGQRSGDGGRGAPPRARGRPRLGGPVTQPRRLSRNPSSGGVGCPRSAEWPRRNRAQPGRMREMKPFPAREAPLPRGTGSGPTPRLPRRQERGWFP